MSKIVAERSLSSTEKKEKNVSQAVDLLP